MDSAGRADELANVSARVVIIGGGISGLAVAHRLIELSAAGDAPAVTVLEASDRLGGQVRTERHDEFLFEAGADSLLAQKPSGLALCRRIGLAAELQDIGARHSGIQILHRGRLLRVPDGFLMMAPTRIQPLLRSALFTSRGKQRMLREPRVPRRPQGVDDESLASFVVRRFGREALDRVAEPVVAGLYTADADRLSLRMAMPRFLDLESKEGSVIRGLRRTKSTRAPRPFGHGTGGGGFFAIRGGLGRLIEALAQRLPAGAVRTNARVDTIRRSSTSDDWTVALADGTSIAADTIVLACPGHESSRIVAGMDPALASELGRLRYASCVTVHLVYSSSAVGKPLSSFGFFVPRTEGVPILACSYVSKKFADRAPRDAVVFRAFLGGATRPETNDLDDAAIVALAHAALKRALGLSSAPWLTRVHRHELAMPQYDVGARDALTKLVAQVESHPELFAAGSVAGAVGIPDCIRVGEEAAERVAQRMAIKGQVLTR